MEVIPVEYEDLSLWSNGIFRSKKSGKYGLVSILGDVLVPNIYSYISLPNCYGKALITKGGKDKNGILDGAKVGLVQSDGRIIIEPEEYTSIYEFNPKTRRPETDDKKEGISMFDTLKTSCDYVCCSVGKQSVIVNEEGKAITPLMKNARYFCPSSGWCAFTVQHSMTKVTSGYWNVEKQIPLIFSKNAKSVVALKCFPFIGNVAKVESPLTRTSFFIDRDGNRLLEDIVKSKHEDRFWILNNKSHNCILFSDEGKIVFEEGKFQDIKFPHMSDVDSVFIPIKSENKWGIMDMSERIVVPVEYDDIDAPVGGWLWATKNGKQGIIDIKGNIIIPFDYSQVVKSESENPNNVWVSLDGVSFYNYNIREGRRIGDAMKVVSDFEEGYAWVVPVEQTLSDNSITKGLKDLYNIRLTSKSETSFGVLVDKDGILKSHVPVPRKMFPVVLNAIKNCQGNLTQAAERKLLLQQTKSVRSYGLLELAGDDWDY